MQNALKTLAELQKSVQILEQGGGQNKSSEGASAGGILEATQNRLDKFTKEIYKIEA